MEDTYVIFFSIDFLFSDQTKRIYHIFELETSLVKLHFEVDAALYETTYPRRHFIRT